MPPETEAPTDVEGPEAIWLGEPTFGARGEGGFQRVAPAPEPLALARLRELLLAVASGGSASLREALEGFRSWQSLATLCGTEWSAGARRSSPAARRVLQRRLRALGAAPVSVARAAELPVGTAVHIRGTIRPALPVNTAPTSDSEGGLKSHIWSHGATYAHNVRVPVERGHDFFLTDDAKEDRATARVIVARGHLINADVLEPGDRVSVFGFTDRVPSGGAVRPDPLDRGAVALAVRAGDDLPLLVRRLLNEGSKEG